MQLCPGLRPGPYWRSLQRFTRLTAAFNGATRRRRVREHNREDKLGRQGKRIKEREGKTPPPE